MQFVETFSLVQNDITDDCMGKRKKSPLVSVIIPTFNRGWIIHEAMDSVFAQDFTDFELIVVDDGSNDDTLNIIGSYPKDMTFIRQNNQGVSAARNKGIAAASGSLIAFLDSDDLWMPKKLSTQAAFFRSNPEALICQTEEIWDRKGTRVNPKKRHKKHSGDIFEASLLLCLVSPSAVMVRRNLFGEVGLFDENLPACEDYDLWLRVSCRYPVYLIDTPLIIKRGGHEDQLSRSPGLDRYRIQSIKKLLDGNLLSEGQYRSAVAVLKEKCTIYANGCRKRNREDEARYYQRMGESYSTEF